VAVKAYSKQANDKLLVSYATEVQFESERIAGELLIEIEKNRGTRGQLQGKESSGGRIALPPESVAIPTLAQLGVTKTQSSRWQQLAKLPAADFKKRVDVAKGKVVDASTSAPRHAKSEFTGEVEGYTPSE
jgi:hypothetical protein